ncbi:ABC transporter substrate-binding protein [Xylophilus sp. GOD-11R]|uniref:ABC transporter substrate-binding protein n=1 Tax=Xylophilus sp. GOD-11R TaxID=3089814 RepID=UPI00298D15BD|nr:ABC transporter substrate-binding protein [Xylophilus sp. GOD-11R]WPB55396.1 ABC transporter substrate-binding protein [Xylophilus sp. GOD-11R]
MSHTFRRRLLLQGGLAAATLPVTFTSQAQGADPTTPQRGGTLVVSLAPEPQIITAAFLTTMQVTMIAGKISEGLVWFDDQLQPQPELAESWAFSPDGLALTLRLRRGVKWHDGHDFTSADVAYSLLNVWQKIHPGGRLAYAPVTAVETPDAHTVVLRLSRPTPYLLSFLNVYGAQVVPRHIYENTDLVKNPANVAPIGTGPFKFKEWVRSSHIALERNPNYWRQGLPYLDGVVFKFIPEAAARSVALTSGEVHVALASNIPVSNFSQFADRKKFRINTTDGAYLASIQLVEVNVRKPALADKRVRQALMFALDRKALLKVVYGGYGRVSDSPIPSTVPAFHSGKGRQYPFDPKQAEALLDAAGLPRKAGGKRLALTIDYGSGSLETNRAAEFMKQSYARIGIDIELRTADSGVLLKRVFNDADFDLFITSLHNLPDPSLGVQRWYWTKNIAKGVPWSNGSGYSNPELDRVMEAAAVEIDPAKRRALIDQWQAIVQEEVPILDLVELDWTTVSTTRYRQVRRQGDGLYASLADAWLAPAAS